MELYKIRDYPQGLFIRAYHKKIYLRLREKVRSIAIYKSGGGLGDLVQSIPLFRSFKEMFPRARIVYLGLYQRPRCNTLFRNIPYIDDYIEYSRPGQENSFGEYLGFLRMYSKRFDLIVDTQSKFMPSFYLWLLKSRYFISRNPFFSHWRFVLNPRRRVHIVAKMLSLARVVGFKDVNFSPVIEIAPEYLSLARDYLGGFSGRFISILPGAGHPYKMWGKERFACLADKFYSMGYRVILVGAKTEQALLLDVAQSMRSNPIIPVIDEPRFGEDPIYSIGLFRLSELTVGCDCGGLHLATLAGCPVIGLYGPTNPIKSGPLGERNVVIYKAMHCSPCGMQSCDAGRRCFNEIKPEEIIEAARFILGG